MHNLIFSILAAAPLAAAQVNLTPNNTANGASQILSPSFAGMGIEASNLYSFTGRQNSPNALSINLLANLANYTGVPPHLRIGGNTQDYMLYDSSFDGWYVRVNQNPSGQGTIPSNLNTIGPSFFAAINRFPPGTPITYGLNMAYQESDYIQQIVNTANASRSMLSQAVLTSFEIGNEPDLYLQNGFRTGAWDSTEYTQQWLTRANAVYEQVLKPYNISANFFEPACTASAIGNSFSVLLLSQDGIMTPANDSAGNKSFVGAFNQHDYFYYIGVSGYVLTLEYMMDLSQTVTQFAFWTTQIDQATALGTPFVLREMASVGPVGESGISDVFGASLWTLNFFLYTATLNISSIQMHMTDNSFASPWLPIPMSGLQPFVRPTYYAWAAMAQVIGGGCATQVQNMPITSFPSGYANNVVAYSVYRNKALSAMVMINTRVSNTSVTDKASTSFVMTLPDHKGQTLYLSYLSGPGTDARHNATWNGMSFEQTSDGTATQVGDGFPPTATIDSTGAVTIAVRDAQAVVAAFDQKIGSGPYAIFNETACKSLAAQRPDPSSYTSPTQVSSVQHSQATATGSSSSNGANSSPGPDTTKNGGQNKTSGAADRFAGSSITGFASTMAFAATCFFLFS